MKKVLLLWCITFSVFGFSQNIQSEIENQFREYNTLMIDRDFEKAIDTYANEDFLKIFSKEQMIALMNQMFNSKDSEFKIHMPKEIVVSDTVIEDQGKKYVKINYEQYLDAKFDAPGIKPQDLLKALQSEFGLNNVVYNQNSGFYEIKASKVAVANSSDSKNWKFTLLEKKQIPILMKFIPESFLRSLN
ncbi:hypothetical protein Q73A0000_06540 [Kaistella flava (ex Peng et al. 2021)]|uniref:Uncharacterized protein n=1 Tax=Kaistella flava (ex Peng et al. 2021) TaxID=2038776 RepID=A0A7M2Y8Q0_9FLAO|nr:hypothetical protein [Kaistella flava (ex Peng et al. 2021)]QOW10044.1 hypothetical protein Q73A0000_06540 [Kaistella flava (ex Peng et al. 2021)]